MSGRGLFQSWRRRTLALGWCGWSSRFPVGKMSKVASLICLSAQLWWRNKTPLTSVFIPFIEYPQGLNIVASITEPGIRSRIPLICENRTRPWLRRLNYYHMLVLGGKPGETYTSDLTCGNTVFHVELVHDGWIKVAHQNFQRLISILVLPVLWHIQSKQVPVGEMQGGIKDFQTWRMHGAATYERRPWTSLQFKLKAFHLPHELAFCCHRLPTFTDKCWTPETTNI